MSDKDQRDIENHGAAFFRPPFNFDNGLMSLSGGAFQAEENTQYDEDFSDISPAIIRKAWFTMAHILVPQGATIVDMGCGDGRMTYAMAVLYPDAKFIGIDRNRQLINLAKKQFSRDNLEFRADDVTLKNFPEQSVDAIINSFVLHEIYSAHSFSERRVADTITAQYRMLKTGGILFIRDFARPPPEEFIQLEFPDKPSEGEGIEGMSEADLLIWYSEHAMPSRDPDFSGFFMEELPPRLPNTRLFRLPYKWAYEFIMRKDDRSHWNSELPKQYTFFTPREMRNRLRELGARVLFTAPHWDENYIAKNFSGHFRMYSEDGKLEGFPATSHLFIARKVGEKRSLTIQERRPTKNQVHTLHINAVRNEKTGEVMDILWRDLQLSEILPYRVTPEGRVKIFVHEGAPRAIVNAIPRSGRIIDRKRWSGHMVEAISTDYRSMTPYMPFDFKNSVKFMSKNLGMMPVTGATLKRGPDYFPDPISIDEKITSWYIEISKPEKTLMPHWSAGNDEGRRGSFREYDAQHLLNAISVGMVPNARLELQIMYLFQTLGIKAENWTDSIFKIEKSDIVPLSIEAFLDEEDEDDTTLGEGETAGKRIIKGQVVPFKKVRGTAGQIHTTQSLFVDEGSYEGTRTTIDAQEIEFAYKDDETINTAVILPLTRNHSGQVMAGFIRDYLPVPQRHRGSGKIIRAPRLNLPPHIKSVEDAKIFIGQAYDVGPEHVHRLGEPYFLHSGITPQRVFPFAITAPVSGSSGPSGLIEYCPMKMLVWISYWFMWEDSFLKVIGKGMMHMGKEVDVSADLDSTKQYQKAATKLMKNSHDLDYINFGYADFPYTSVSAAQDTESGSGDTTGGTGTLMELSDIYGDISKNETDANGQADPLLPDVPADDSVSESDLAPASGTDISKTDKKQQKRPPRPASKSSAQAASLNTQTFNALEHEIDPADNDPFNADERFLEDTLPENHSTEPKQKSKGDDTSGKGDDSSGKGGDTNKYKPEFTPN